MDENEQKRNVFIVICKVVQLPFDFFKSCSIFLQSILDFSDSSNLGFNLLQVGLSLTEGTRVHHLDEKKIHGNSMKEWNVFTC